MACDSRSIILFLVILTLVRSCEQLEGTLREQCEVGREVKRQGISLEDCYFVCERIADSALNRAACFKGCFTTRSDKESAAVSQDDSSSVLYNYHGSSTNMDLSQTVMRIKQVDGRLVYKLTVNGELVSRDSLSMQPNQELLLTYSTVSWSTFSTNTDYVLAVLACACLILGLLLLLMSCAEDCQQRGGSGEEGRKEEKWDERKIPLLESYVV